MLVQATTGLLLHLASNITRLAMSEAQSYAFSFSQQYSSAQSSQVQLLTRCFGRYLTFGDSNQHLCLNVVYAASSSMSYRLTKACGQKLSEEAQKDKKNAYVANH